MTDAVVQTLVDVGLDVVNIGGCSLALYLIIRLIHHIALLVQK
ncbi:hypothetical protein [Dokdonella soli]